MKIIFLIIAFYFFSSNLLAQKDSDGNYLCKADSLLWFVGSDLSKDGADGIIIFDCKGRRNNSSPFIYIFWSKDSVGYLRQFGGCDKIKEDQTFSSKEALELLDLYKTYSMDTISSRTIKGSLNLYHAKSCIVYAKLSGKTQKFGYQLPSLGWIKEQAKEFELRPSDSIDPRTLIIQKFEQLRNTSNH